MPRVQLYGPLRFNLSGNDREPVAFPAGEQDVPDVVADFLVRNPSCGSTLIGEVRPEESLAAIVEPVEPVEPTGDEGDDDSDETEPAGNEHAGDEHAGDEPAEPEELPAPDPDTTPDPDPTPAPRPAPKRRR